MRNPPAWRAADQPSLISGGVFSWGVVLLVAVFIATAAARRAPEALFGSMHDDALYFATAKALASGEGLTTPSLPGSPPQTKYPPLYPLLLSAVWLAAPEFPANLEWAWALTLLFGVGAAVVFVVAARQLGSGRGEALFLAALAVLNPYFVHYSNVLGSDVVFAALAVGATALAHESFRRGAQAGPRLWGWAGAVLLLWLACLTRTVGVAFVAGVAATALWRGRPAAATAALSGAVPVALGMAGVFGRMTLPAAAESWEGFRQNLLYYFSYTEFWRLSAPSWDVFLSQASFNFTELLKHPASSIFLLRAEGFAPMWLQSVAITLSFGIVAGVVRRARRAGLHPLHLAGIFYLPIILPWNYPLMARFGLPFGLLLLVGASEQLRAIATQLSQAWRQGPAADRLVGAAMAAALLGLAVLGAYRSVWETPRGLARSIAERAALAPAKLEAYAWLAANAEPEAVVISDEDASLYLYAGRRGMRPVSLTTEAFFRQDMAVFQAGLDRLADTAFALEARYWLTAPDDFSLGNDPETTAARVGELLDGLPAVFSSRDGAVRIFALEGARWARAKQERLAARRGPGDSPRPPSD